MSRICWPNLGCIVSFVLVKYYSSTFSILLVTPATAACWSVRWVPRHRPLAHRIDRYTDVADICPPGSFMLSRYRRSVAFAWDGQFNFMVIRGIELPCFKDLSHFFLVHPYISKNLVLPVHWCEAAPRRRPLALRKSSYLDGAVPSILHSLRNKPI